jgi:type II secretory pathway pseudopilin PulG
MGMRRGRDGFTTVELTVVVLLVGLATVAILGVLDSLTRNQRTQDALVTNQERVRQAMTEMGRELRSADPLLPLDDAVEYPYRFEATLPARSDNGPDTYVRWELSGTTLSRSVLTGPGGSAASTRSVLTNVRNIGQGQPMLRYFNTDGSEIPVTAAPGDFANCAVRVAMTISADSEPGPLPFSQTSDVQVRNRLPGGVGC